MFEYDHDFWFEWASGIDLEMNQNMLGSIGKNVPGLFEKYGMTKYSKDENG